MATRRRRALTRAAALLAVLGLALLAWFHRGQLGSSLGTLAHLRWEWVPPAVIAESGSMVALARSQRQLLTVRGDTLPLRSAVAVVYASNALALSVPIAGAGLGAGFSFRQFRNRGVQPAMVGWALTVSGVMSALSFALVMTIGAGISGNSTAILVGLSGAALSALPVLVLLAAVRSPRVRVWLLRWVNRAVSRSHRVLHHPRRDAIAGLEEILDRVGDVRATPRQYTVAFSLALRNWIGDCLCLLCSIKASGSPTVPWHGLILAYCFAVTAGSAGLTPGGIGVVDATLSAGLIASHMPAKYALPSVLVYRLISLWLVVGVGWLIAARLTHEHNPREAIGDEEEERRKQPPSHEA
jgi:uncharacterized membrane protein YbhN (UPF0104 family)